MRPFPTLLSNSPKPILSENPVVVFQPNFLDRQKLSKDCIQELIGQLWSGAVNNPKHYPNPQIGDKCPNAVCRIVEQFDHQCGDDLVVFIPV